MPIAVFGRVLDVFGARAGGDSSLSAAHLLPAVVRSAACHHVQCRPQRKCDGAAAAGAGVRAAAP